MMDRELLKEWIVEALGKLERSGTILEISKQVWHSHQEEIKQAGDGFYTWQYDIRWSAKKLRDEGRLKGADDSPRGRWELK